MKPIIYLAGPIQGESYTKATQWREDINSLLNERVICLDPMRSKQFLAGEDSLENVYEHDSLTTKKAIISRDFLDVRRSDLILVNFLNAKRVSIGTMAEIGAAYALNIPILLVMEEKGNIHDHPFVTETASFRISNIQDAPNIISKILSV